MARDPEGQAFRADGGRELAHDVALWSTPRRRPLGEGAVVHGEAVVVLGHGYHVSGACCLEQSGPAPGVELLGLEALDEVLVAELRLRAVGGDVVVELLLAALVHVPRVPLVAEGGHRVGAPMDEDPQLAVEVPPRSLELLEGRPGGCEGATRGHGLHLGDLFRNGAVGGVEGDRREQQHRERAGLHGRGFYRLE